MTIPESVRLSQDSEQPLDSDFGEQDLSQASAQSYFVLLPPLAAPKLMLSTSPTTGTLTSGILLNLFTEM